MQSLEWVLDTLYQSEDSCPTIQTNRIKEENWETVKKTYRTTLENKIIRPALNAHQSHTIEYRVSNIVPQRYRQENKSLAVLGGSAAWRRISMQMYKYADEQQKNHM